VWGGLGGTAVPGGSGWRGTESSGVLGVVRPSVSVSSSTQTKLLMVSRIFSTLSAVGWEDASFKVDPRCSRECVAIRDSKESRAKPRR
jgi:hypothetical protein